MTKLSEIAIVCFLIIFSLMLVDSTTAQPSIDDDCPNFEGNSTNDRMGCLDSDGDGWSNPDDNWTTANGADAFPSEKTQWKDVDKDGFGDNSSIGAKNIDYWPDDRLRHKPVILIACDPASHTTTVNEVKSFSCKVTNPMESISVNLRIKWVSQDGISSDWDSKEVKLNPTGEKGHLTMFSIRNTAEKIGLSVGEVEIWVQDQNEPSAIAKLPILVTENFENEGNIIGEEVSEVFSFSRMHDGVVQVSNKIEEESGISIPTWAIYTLLVVMFSISLKKPTRIFSKPIKFSKSYKNKHKESHITDYQNFKGTSKVVVERKVEKTNKNEVVSTEFDYIPKRLRK